MRLRDIGLAALACAGCIAQAQGALATPDPDWKESEVPAPPALRSSGLIPLEMPGSALRFGVDPKSVVLDRDGIVRYVVVASSAQGAVNAMYEGIRCNTGEFRIYARHTPDRGWVMVNNSVWRSLQDAALTSRYSMEIARNGACVGNGPNRSAERIVRDLAGGPDKRFN